MGFASGEAIYLPPEVRTGFAIIFGELDGGKFDWDQMEWKEQK